MDEMKKPKIVVVGVGDGMSNLIDSLSGEMTDDNVKSVKVAYRFKNENANATEIILPHFRPIKRSLEEVCAYLERKGHTDELAKLISTIQDGDELYLLIPHGDLIFYMGFRLKRDGEIIMQFLEEH